MNKQKYSFEFVDDVATADAAFRAFGADPKELFAACGAALFSAIIDLEVVGATSERAVTLKTEDYETLLYDWLSELVYLKDVKRELYSVFLVDIAREGELRLTATVRGEKIDSSKHITKTDVKAVTYHRLKVEQTGSGWEAFVVLDL